MDLAFDDMPFYAIANIAPTKLSAIQAGSQSILSMNNHTPLVISGKISS
jgi:hypothetical protein